LNAENIYEEDIVKKNALFVLLVLFIAPSCSVSTQLAKEAKAPARVPVQRYTDPVTGMEFLLVKGGCFDMGDAFGDGYSDEVPVHQVCVNDFYIGKYVVTQDQWSKVMGNNPSSFATCGGTCPVEKVSWNDAQRFIYTLNQRSGKNYRLPTEAE
jgi:formylglycine-generating enzyme required for sulfatase activity